MRDEMLQRYASGLVIEHQLARLFQLCHEMAHHAITGTGGLEPREYLEKLQGYAPAQLEALLAQLDSHVTEFPRRMTQG